MRHILLCLVLLMIGSLLALTGAGRSAGAVMTPVATGSQAETQRVAASLPPVPLNARRIAAGGSETCAVTMNGIAKCWGWNRWGQLGDGTTTNKPWPTDVVGLGRYPPLLSVGAYHACVLTAGGGVQCWGYNDYGQLGDDTITGRLLPTDVVGLSSGTQSIAAGMFHSCAVTAAGGAQCWGDNSSVQLGDGTATSRLTPTDVVGLSNGVQAISAGGRHTCALMTSGGVKCWGDRFGATPADVNELSGAVQMLVTGWQHNCALTTAGAVKCWGGNSHGQLGDGTGMAHSTPVDVVGLTSDVQAIAANGLHSCALTTSGGVKCWGYNNQGQLGDGTVNDRLTPTNVIGLPGAMLAIGAGDYHTCALAVDNSVWCWGSNAAGELGDGTKIDRWTPVQVIQKPAFDCAAVTEIPQRECLALRALADHANWLGWRTYAGWEQPTTPCAWYGVTCQDGHVTAINLRNNYLVGALSAEIGDLSYLTQLNLSSNFLSGSLPAELGQLTALQGLDLHDNQLSGPLPATLGHLVALRTLDLYGNQISGPIPAELGNLTSLVELNLAGNELSGAAPAALGQLVNLTDLSLHSNHLQGALPPEWGNLSNLRHLELGSNQFSGAIPPEWGRLSALEDLHLDNNDLSGAIPPELGNLTGIRARWSTSQAFGVLIPPPTHGYLTLRGNHLSGSVPVELSQLYQAASIELGCNRLSGPFPPPGGEAMNQNTFAEYNMLSGADPHGYWDLSQTLPPTNLSAIMAGDGITLTWIPIPYTGHGGFYEVSYATAPDGPFTVHGHTADKTVGSYTATGSPPGSAYYFRVRTFTPAHQAGACNQPNDLWSDYSAVVSAGTAVRRWLPLVRR